MAKKKAKKPKRTSKVSNNYSAEGGKVSKKNKECPKCGSGVFLAKHKNRLTCGKCHYMEKL